MTPEPKPVGRPKQIRRRFKHVDVVGERLKISKRQGCAPARRKNLAQSQIPDDPAERLARLKPRAFASPRRRSHA
jgi:hypothetical protein